MNRTAGHDEDTLQFPEPDAVLTEKPSLKKYLKYLLFFGPGAVVVSVTIGQGQLILGPQMGAWADFKLLWLITINIASYIIAFVACRFMLFSGLNIMDLLALKTKKGWLNWLFILIIFIFVPLFTAAIITTLGQSIQWIIGGGNYLVIGTLFCLFAAILALVGRYRLVEYSQAFFVVVLGIGAIASVIVIKPDLINILPHFFLVANPGYPEWLTTNFPDEAATPIPLLMLGYLGTLSITLITIPGYLAWIKIKRWGIFKDKADPDAFSRSMFDVFKRKGKITYLPRDEGERKKARTLLKPVLIDLGMAFLLVSIISAAYMIAGAYLLGPQPDGTFRFPTNINLLREQGVIFSNMAPWLEPLYQISVVFALFGTVYAGFEAVSRMVYETARGVSRKLQEIPYKKFMGYFMLYILFTGIPLAIMGYYGVSILLMLSLTLLFIGVVGVIIYGIGVIYLSQTILPEEYRLGKAGVALSIIAIILLCIPMLFFFI
ncbi:MAG: hypothetical protein FE046_01050 [Thermoplasmata archaeon]|nr:MAG: hypothetical protein FE046_01050 [Thermoplasmata archaeon]RLF33829.1 MAG: hypothetical protein DRN07_01470 [Thermoplasmata archaeon]